MQANSLVLSACIAEVESMRYTPAGLPALNLRLEHESRVTEAEGQRTVKVVVKAVAFGTLAERLAKQAIGSVWKFNGFLANARQGKSLVFHIQDFLQD
ncbi:primosomal replication protein N [Rhodoferax sp.]|uniref:primosomal replication protein N n=1 Tax=Rhodoferax sp. TaxID=50421 RepID=UPI002ACED37F|nr:primosomal replication protein N [Rhodoferax sp.]MDZ7918605.1 primosomal replication protein N [Rhodoferax sp.]